MGPSRCADKKPFPQETWCNANLAAGGRDVGRRHDDAALRVALQPRAGLSVPCRQVRRELGQARELEGRQVAALQVLGHSAAMAGEVRTDEELLVLQADQRLGYAERAAEMRQADERFGKHYAQARAFEQLLPAALDAERRQTEVAGMAAGVRAAALECLAREQRQFLRDRWIQVDVLAAEAQRYLVRDRAVSEQRHACCQKEAPDHSLTTIHPCRASAFRRSNSRSSSAWRSATSSSPRSAPC